MDYIPHNDSHCNDDRLLNLSKATAYFLFGGVSLNLLKNEKSR
jgi:hypothetical protein